jgi:hypothetical protein
MIHKAYHGILNPRSAKTFAPYQDLENKQMLCSFLESPDDFKDHIRRYTNSLTTQMIYGFRTINNDDPRLKRLYLGVERWSNVLASTTAALLDTYPILRKLPDFMIPMRPMCQKYHQQEKELYDDLWSDAKQKIANGTAMVCMFLVPPLRKENKY